MRTTIDYTDRLAYLLEGGRSASLLELSDAGSRTYSQILLYPTLHSDVGALLENVDMQIALPSDLRIGERQLCGRGVLRADSLTAPTPVLLAMVSLLGDVSTAGTRASRLIATSVDSPNVELRLDHLVLTGHREAVDASGFSILRDVSFTFTYTRVTRSEAQHDASRVVYRRDCVDAKSCSAGSPGLLDRWLENIGELDNSCVSAEDQLRLVADPLERVE